MLYEVITDLEQPFGCIWASVQYDILDAFTQICRNVVVYRQLAGVDDAHRESGFDGVIEEYRMYRFSYAVVAAERKRHIADATLV